METNDKPEKPALARRDMLKTMGAALALGPGTARSAFAATDAGPSAPANPAGAGPYNILFILTDQERFFRPGELPAGYRLPPTSG